MFTVRCAGCGHDVPLKDDRPPPWCPKCGGDVRGTPMLTPTGMLSIMPESTLPTPAALRPQPMPQTAAIPQRMPFFSARELSTHTHAFRVYVLPSELLFMRLDSGSDLAENIRLAATLFGGAAGAMAAKNLTGEAAEDRNHLRAQRAHLLDVADEDTLLQLAEMEDFNFSASMADVQDVRLDPASTWIRITHGVQHTGILKFKHRTAGRRSFALPEIQDVQLAAEGLNRVLGPAAQINVQRWGSARW